MEISTPLSQESLDEFGKSYEFEFGANLAHGDLERKTRMLLNLYKAVYGSPVEIVKLSESSLTIK